MSCCLLIKLILQPTLMKYSGLKMSPAKFFKIVRLTETNKIHIWMLPLQSNHTAAPCGFQTLII